MSFVCVCMCAQETKCLTIFSMNKIVFTSATVNLLVFANVGYW